MKEDLNDRWGISSCGDLVKRWPRGADGELESPVFIGHYRNINFADATVSAMLEAYGIPCLRIFSGNGSFGNLILGVSGEGVDLYVPQSRGAEALELCQEPEDFEMEDQ